MRIRAEVVAKQDPYLFAFAPSDDPELEAHVYEAMESGIENTFEADPDVQLIESMVWTDEKVAKLGIPSGLVARGWDFGLQVSPETYRRVAVGDTLEIEIA
jgi:hypothetical protein